MVALLRHRYFPSCFIDDGIITKLGDLEDVSIELSRVDMIECHPTKRKTISALLGYPFSICANVIAWLVNSFKEIIGDWKGWRYKPMDLNTNVTYAGMICGLAFSLWVWSLFPESDSSVVEFFTFVLVFVMIILGSWAFSYVFDRDRVSLTVGDESYETILAGRYSESLIGEWSSTRQSEEVQSSKEA